MLGENDRRNIIVGSLVVVALMLVCVGTLTFYKSLVPVQVDKNTINVSKAEYDQAFAKWQAKGVTEYELTIHGSQDDVVIHVADHGQDISVIKAVHGGESSGQNVPSSSALLRQMTVERMFQITKNGLDASLASESGQGTNGNSFSDYAVTFDPTLGYPTHFAEYNRVTKPTREITWRTEVLSPFEVTDLKIIK